MPGMDRTPGGAEAGRSGCVAETKRGTACRSFALRDRAYCIAHDPEGARAARLARAKGGAAASKLRALRGRRAKLDTVPSLVGFTAGVIQDALAGTLAPEIARVVLYGLSIQKGLVEAGDLDKRMTELEAQLGADRPEVRRA